MRHATVMSSISPTPGNYQPERIWDARRAYFEQGLAPAHLVDTPLLRSWERCRQSGRFADEAVAFDPVERAELRRLLQAEHALLHSVQPAMDSLARALAPAGYAIMLTNSAGRVVAVGGEMARLSAATQQAFRAGVDVSERMVGTSAMALALAERSAQRVRGGEHYFELNQIFHCYATPVFDLRGQLLGSLDVTRDVPELAQCAIALTRHCAAEIEWNMLRALPAFLKVQLDGAPDAWMAFDGDGRVLGASSGARYLLGLPELPAELGFDDVCEGRFAHWVSSLRSGPRGQACLRLRDGVELHTRALAHTPRLLPVSEASAEAVTTARHEACPELPRDARLLEDFTRALRAFEAGVPVLLRGETGVGKEVAARTLHRLSRRSEAAWMAINCGAMAPELVAAELFGHAEGAYTGSVRGGRAGVFEAAHGGTVFLDEVGDMPAHLQVALLRVLDTSEVLRVGSTRPVRVDVSVICATHRDLPAMVRDGLFREDLYFRLAGYTLALPALREREDFDHVLDQVLLELGACAHCVGDALRNTLREHAWPGNVRELRHVLRVALALAPDPRQLRADDLRQAGLGAVGRSPAQRVTREQPLALREQQSHAIDEALMRCNGDVTRAAALLGISRATLYRRLKDRRG